MTRRAAGREAYCSVDSVPHAFRVFETLNGLVDADMPSDPKLVALVLLRHADNRGQCYPSTGQLVDKSSISRAAVYRARTWLREHGVIDWTPPCRYGYHCLYQFRPTGEWSFSETGLL